MRYLSLLVFSTGAATLGMELSAARLLEPSFGNNQLIWAALIGLILLYLAVGAWLGGKLADRFPQRRALDATVTLACIGLALVPTLSQPVLRLAAVGLAEFAPGLLASALLAILLLFSLPGVLFGTATPWALRLAVADLSQTGQTAGRLYAIGTAGSLVGTFLPVLWLIPAYGTRWTFYILALAPLAVVALGSLGQRHRWIPLGGVAVVLALLAITQPTQAVRAAWDDQAQGELIYEDESRYNYIAVRQWGPERHLKLNDGVGIHSVYHPQMLLSNGIWDYFLLAPLFQNQNGTRMNTGGHGSGNPSASAQSAFHPPDNLLLIGLAAGTVSELYTDIYGPLPITGIELDPQILDVGRTYFGMTQPNLTAVAADGRAWLAQQPMPRSNDARWDVIAVDAYRPPYIPFHLTTLEFFTLIHSHLEEDGVLAINVGRTPENFALVDALSATLLATFPSVYVIDEPGPPGTLANSLVVATMQPTALADVQRRAADLPEALPAEFRDFASSAAEQARIAQPPADAPIFTDDRAPVEQLVHGIILDFLRE